MKRLASFVFHTIAGAVWFLFPLAAIAIVLGKAHEWAEKIIVPLAGLIPADSFLGVGAARILAALFLVLLCFFAALFSKTKIAKALVRWLERTVLHKLPGYTFLKTIAVSRAGLEGEGGNDVVLARIEDALQLGFITEDFGDGRFAVFVPGAPMPWSGNLYFMTEDRFRRLNIPYKAALACLRQLGRGAKDLLADPTPPKRIVDPQGGNPA